ncbi:hypothetical protein L9F63_018684, partial [Diploptera punctata]
SIRFYQMVVVYFIFNILIIILISCLSISCKDIEQNGKSVLETMNDKISSPKERNNRIANDITIQRLLDDDENPSWQQLKAIRMPTATILGGPDLHVDKGSTINLTCTIKYSPEPPAYIFWYHHDEVISYDSNRGGVSVITEKGDVTTSYLLIQHAELSDSGKYSCSPSNADVASVRVHVLNGEYPAAMQTGSAGLSNNSISMATVVLLSLFYDLKVPRQMAALKMATIEQLTAEEFRQLELGLRMNTTVFETAVSWKHESYELNSLQQGLEASHLNTPATLFMALQKMDHYSQTISPRKFKF